MRNAPNAKRETLVEFWDKNCREMILETDVDEDGLINCVVGPGAVSGTRRDFKVLDHEELFNAAELRHVINRTRVRISPTKKLCRLLVGDPFFFLREREQRQSSVDTLGCAKIDKSSQ